MHFKLLFLPKRPVFCLRGKRVIVRLPQKSDWQSWRDARVSSFELLQPVEPTWPENMHEWPSFQAYLERAKFDLKAKKAVRTLILSVETDQVLGGINLSRIEWGAKRAGLISYWLRQSNQNQGYMSEALSLLLDYAFTQLKLNRIEAEVMESNQTSVHLLKRLGFSHEGRCIKNIKIAGEWQDHERYALLNSNLD